MAVTAAWLLLVVSQFLRAALSSDACVDVLLLAHHYQCNQLQAEAVSAAVSVHEDRVFMGRGHVSYRRTHVLLRQWWALLTQASSMPSRLGKLASLAVLAIAGGLAF